MNGFMVAAPHSGSGKTTVTLGLLRALRNRGVAVAPAKAGPDYIDPAFHAFASEQICTNLDPWAMRGDLITGNAALHAQGRLLVVEAMMGLFDGAADGTGSAADLAELLGLPVIFVVDCARMAQSISALVSGYRNYSRNIGLAGVILNRVGSARHETMLRAALEPLAVPVLGVVMQDEKLVLPNRHLGLVQASEHESRESFLDYAGSVMEQSLSLDSLCNLNMVVPPSTPASPLPPFGQHTAIAVDDAFAFCYPHMIDGWRSHGAAISFFSPLADEEPAADADAVYLPGGYPELHAGVIAGCDRFRAGITKARDRGACIYGECGGYMVLGDGLIDGDGKSHRMLGFLPLETSFQNRKRHLGYRRLSPANGPWRTELKGHEFHYSTVVREGGADPLFEATDALGNSLGASGQCIGSVSGSYMHVIDRVV